MRPRANKSLAVKLLVFVLVTLSVCGAAYADQYELFVDNPNGDHSSGVAKRFEGRYDPTANTLRWKAVFEATVPDGFLPQGWWFVLGPGPVPRGDAGEYAILYLDAYDPAAPTLVVYGYNGVNGGNSFLDGDGNSPGTQTPDRILSSKVDSSWITTLSVTDDSSGPLPLRTFEWEINVAAINAHVPLYPSSGGDPWYGTGFGDEATSCGSTPHLGLWFHPRRLAAAPSYCAFGDPSDVCLQGASIPATGFIKSMPFVGQGWFDWECIPVNTRPTCEGLVPPGGDYVAFIGDPLMVTVTGSDADSDEQLTVQYSGAPTSATWSLLPGSTGAAPLSTAFQWTPTLADAGSEYDVSVEFTDSYGSSVSCPFHIRVNTPPVCDLGGPYLDLVCAGAETQVLLDLSGTFDPDTDPIDLAFATTCDGGAASIELVDPITAAITISEPGQGIAANCSVTMEVSDGGDSTTCSAPLSVLPCELDCLGDPNGQAELDLCGVCNGTNACLDCESVPFGGKVVDRCGVCGGDGTSCLECSESDITAAQFALDGNSDRLRGTVIAGTKQLRRKAGYATTDPFIAQVRIDAEKLFFENWNLVWTELTSLQTTCENQVFCVSVSNEPTIQVFEGNTEKLGKIVSRIARQLRRAGAERAAAKLAARGNRLVKEALSLSAELPKSSSLCS